MIQKFLQQSPDRLGIFVSLLAAFIFGLYPPAARAAYQDGANAIFMMLLTTFIRTASMLLYCCLTGRSLFQTRQDRRIAISGGFFQAISIVGIIASLTYLPGPVMIMIVFSHTIMLLLYMMVRREMPFNGQTIMITLSNIVGLSLVVDVWNAHNALPPLGLALAFMAALATTSRLYIYGKLTQTRDAITVGAEAFSCCFLFLLLAPFFQVPAFPIGAAGWVWSLLAGVSLSLGTFAMFNAIAMLGAFKNSMFSKMEPLFNALFSALLLGEVLNGTQYAGMAIVIGSLVIFQRQQRKAT